MDTNLNNDQNAEIKKPKKNIMAFAWATLLLIFLITFISVFSYEPLRYLLLNPSDDVDAYIESDSFINCLGNLTYYTTQTKINDSNWHDYSYENLKNIKYYINNQDKTLNITNMPGISENSLQEQMNNSLFYLHVRTDDKGNSQIESSLGEKFNERAFKDNSNFNNENKVKYANLDIVYVVPKAVNDYDLFMHNVKEFNAAQYIVLILAIGAVSVIILSIIAFAVPYSSQSKASICRLFNAMFLELKFLIWLGFISFCNVGLNFVGGYSYEAINLYNMICDGNLYFYLIGIPVTFVLYLLIYLSICYMKYIYNNGFVEGVIKNSMAGRICFYIITKLKKLLEEIADIDVAKEGYRKLLLVLCINLIALWIIVLAGPFGLILAVAYTIFLFKYLMGIIAKVKALNDATKKLAEGDFNITIDQDMGILSPISKNLNNIKEGFKVAVEKELKSQNMKTELISNVSHDLKTPLTSIITYVDLLKNEDIKNQKERDYIDILDKKSKRLKVLIDDLFEASKAGSGNIELHLEKLDAVALLRQTLGELEEKINSSTLEFKVNAPDSKVICELDGRRTYRVFENIMSNILKYSMPNSRVYIDVSESEKEVSFIFKNISSYEMNFDASEITERFTRGDKSRNTEGSGLGLAIAKSLTELQNGKMAITIDGDLFKLTVTFTKA